MFQGVSGGYAVLGDPSAKVCSSARCCVLAFKASMLYPGGSICQSVFICQVLCTGIQGIYAVFVGGPPAKVCISAKCWVLVFKASMLYLWGVLQPKKVCLPSTSLANRWGSIGQRRFVCQVLVLLVGGGSIGQRRFVCQI